MPLYLTLHHDPELLAEEMESNWIKLAKERRAVWVKTWYNIEQGRRFCWWDAPAKEALEQVLRDHGIAWKDIIQVELTTPSDWRWRED